METVNHAVGDEHADEQNHKAIDQFLHIMQDEKRGTHDDKVAHHVDFAVRDIAVFAYHEGNDVKAAGVAAPVDGDASAQSA